MFGMGFDTISLGKRVIPSWCFTSRETEKENMGFGFEAVCFGQSYRK